MTSKAERRDKKRARRLEKHMRKLFPSRGFVSPLFRKWALLINKSEAGKGYLDRRPDRFFASEDHEHQG